MISFPYAGANSVGENLFPNPEWQMMSGIGPSWDGNPATLQAYLDSFPTEWNTLYTGNLPAIAVTNVSVVILASGQPKVTITGDVNVQYLYPGSLIAFASTAHATLKTTTMRVFEVNYNTRTFVVYPPRGGVPTSGAVVTACRPVMRADMTGVTGIGPDGWNKFPATAFCWLDRAKPAGSAGMTGTPGYTSNLSAGVKRRAIIMPADNNATYFYWNIPANDVGRVRGSQISFGMWIDRVANGSASLFVNDGSITLDTNPVSSANGKVWRNMTYTVSNTATFVQIGVCITGSSGYPWAIERPVCMLGPSIRNSIYVFPNKGAVFKPTVKYTPDSFFGAGFTFPASPYGFQIDFFGETGGALSEDLTCVIGQLEGIGNTPNQAISTRNQYGAPQIYGGLIICNVNGVNNATTISVALEDGCAWMYSNAASTWTGVSIDINQTILR